MTINDLELLQAYAREKSEAAFATLVSRHLNLVYSAALRQVRSPQLAEEVSQSVFSDLARNATRLKPDTVLTAWLYQVTRRTAIDVVRRESRRQARERIAVEMAAMNTTPDWNPIEPLLDEGMESLDDTDRAAILLRYFENKSLREVGAALGTSDDAAQKRVSRAVDSLRDFFAKRGVAVGAAGLAVVISTNAVQAAPAGLALSLAGVSGKVTTTSLLKLMAAIKVKIGIAAAVVALGVATTAIVVVEHSPAPKPVPAATGPGAVLKSTWHFAGYATPEDALMSYLWAASLGDAKNFKASLAPSALEQFTQDVKKEGKSENQVLKEMAIISSKILSYRIMDRKTNSPELVVLTVVCEGGVNPSDEMTAVKDGNEWKLDEPW